ncbi:MAG: TIGR00159 family protein [Anaerolineales bacterium]|nr:TIGR00159 family protein [Anaerolineales bacterium]
MPDILASFGRLLNWTSLIDVALVALVIYLLLRLFSGTQAMQLLRGLLIVALVIAILSQVVDLPAFNWLLRNSLPVVLFAIPVIFQPELRRALERLGRSAPLFLQRGDTTKTQNLINEVVRSVDYLAQRRTGALIVFHGITELGDIIDRGVRVDGEVTFELLSTIFFPNTPLHDGAVIVRGDRLLAASCVLPLTDRELSDSQLGTRHRAAIGVTEQSDALVVVVSEETGRVSVARNGRIVRIDTNRLRAVLSDFFSTT